MSRKVTFSDVEKITTFEPLPDCEYQDDDDDDEPLPKKRLLDPGLGGDEEDDDEEEEKAIPDVAVDPDELITGCQEAGIAHDEEGIKFTPFNLQEELEDGHFDAHGNYVFNKVSKIRDNWMDNVDWEEVRFKSDVATTLDESVDEKPTESKTISSLYEDLLPMLNDGETVLQAIRRLGVSKSQSKSKRPLRPWEKKKLESEGKLSPENDNQEDIQSMLRLTEIADALLQAGEFDVYQESKEKIAFRCKSKTTNGQKHCEPSSSGDADDDDELDQLGANFDEQTENSTKEQHVSQSSNIEKRKESLSNVVQWEVKMDALDDTPSEGPFTSWQMDQWVKEGKYTQTKALVRKIGTQNFSAIHRIDFELYLD